MKYNLLLLLFLSLCSILPATTHADIHTGKSLTKDYVFVPGGSEGESQLHEFYISSTEVTNRQYRVFIQDLADSGATEKLKLAMVDTSQWGKKFKHAGPFTHFYYQNSAYDDYPVVNVSRRGAELYCEWLTDRYNSSSRPMARFKLPTEVQWEYAAKGGNPKAIYPWPGSSLTYQRHGKWRGTNMCNYLVDSAHATLSHIQNDTADITAPARSFMPNTYDIYNMAGNVAEMVSDQDYTKGGSYLSPASRVLISAHEDADLSHGLPTVGFRPVMTFVVGE
jgi:formylglycine-generating enzyme required for sulfatase activity